MGGIQSSEKEKITDIRNDEYIWEMGKFNPELVRLSSINYGIDYGKLERNENLVKNFYKHVVDVCGNNELAKYLESLIKENGYYVQKELHTQQGIEKVNQITKLILNEDIIKAVPGSDILEYAQNPSQEKLVEIVRKTYGETSAKILEDRPKIDIDLIPNFNIFKPEIVNIKSPCPF